MRLLPLALAAFLTGTSPVFAQDANYDAGTVLATINGTDITLGNLIALMERLPEQYQNYEDQQLYVGMLDQLIDQAILAGTEQMDPAQDDLRTQLMLKNERNSIIANRIISRLAAEPIDEAALQAAYDEQFANVAPTLEYSAAHILLPTAEEAQAVIEMVNGGADFADVAREKSTGPSGPRGGDLGWFADGQMVPEFQAAVAALEKGAVSEPVQTQFGWHVIKLNDTREKLPPSLDDVREQLTAQVRDANIKAQLDELRAGADVQRTEAKVPFSAIRESGLLNAQ
jgi:peptidyl-prolyl cis-trans isomerase C